jgi:hypothetical protein
MRREASLQAKRLMVAAAAIGVTAWWGSAVPQGESGIDQRVYRQVIARMHQGQGYYQAFRDGFADVGIRVSEPRSFRTPTTFLLWRVLPQTFLYTAFLLLIVIATSLLLLWLTEHPLLVLPVTLYLLDAGTTYSRATKTFTDGYLLQELWVLPFVVGWLLAWRQQRWVLASTLATAAVLVRELAILLLVGSLIQAWVERRPRRPWVIGLAVASGALVVHAALAAGTAYPSGNEAPLFGSGRPPTSVLEIMDWPVPGPLFFGLVMWVLAVVWLHRRGELLLVGPYLGIALLGVFVRRPYWGLMLVPLTLFWTLELIVSLVERRWPSDRRPRLAFSSVPSDTRQRSEPSSSPS